MLPMNTTLQWSLPEYATSSTRMITIKTAADLIAEVQTQINCIDVISAKKLYDCAENPLIIDVREAKNADKSKLKDSINISRGLIEMKITKHCPDSGTLILTHCGGGGRASLAAFSLKQMGYTNVHAITASFDEIKNIFG